MKELDVRSILKAGGEPFDQIMAFVNELAPGESFRLWATFKPAPLLSVLAQKGYQGTATEMEDGSWAVDFVPRD